MQKVFFSDWKDRRSPSLYEVGSEQPTRKVTCQFLGSTVSEVLQPAFCGLQFTLD